jgi:hypothetical protein
MAQATLAQVVVIRLSLFSSIMAQSGLSPEWAGYAAELANFKYNLVARAPTPRGDRNLFRLYFSTFCQTYPALVSVCNAGSLFGPGNKRPNRAILAVIRWVHENALKLCEDGWGGVLIVGD